MSELWCIRIPGPDDVFAKPSKEHAEKAKIEHDAAITEWYGKQKEGDFKYLPLLENMLAVVELWPWDAQEHEQSMAEDTDT